MAVNIKKRKEEIAKLEKALGMTISQKITPKKKVTTSKKKVVTPKKKVVTPKKTVPKKSSAGAKTTKTDTSLYGRNTGVTLGKGPRRRYVKKMVGRKSKWKDVSGGKVKGHVSKMI